MLNFDFSEKGLGTVYPPNFGMIFQQKSLSCFILSTYQILLSDCLYFLRYWAICVLQLSVDQVLTS